LAGGAEYDNALWVFKRIGTTWTQQQKITVTDSIGNAHMGYSVALSSDGKTLSAGGNDDNTGQGAVWVFTNYGTTWLEQKKITVTDNIGNAQLGYSVALSAQGNTLASGALTDNGIGATWIFV
jgi:hypothetical protein